MSTSFLAMLMKLHMQTYLPSGDVSEFFIVFYMNMLGIVMKENRIITAYVMETLSTSKSRVAMLLTIRLDSERKLSWYIIALFVPV